MLGLMPQSTQQTTQQKVLPNSLWAATAEPAPETLSLNRDINVDVAIVGAGFSGLRAALVLAESGLQVAVFDAGDIGWGASGRNGGQVNPIGHEPPSVIAQRWDKQYGGDYAQRFTALITQSADEVFDVIKHYAIRCDAEQNGWIRALHSNIARPAFETLYRDWRDAGADLHWIEPQTLEQLSGAKGYKAGWIARRGGSVQPLSYVRGLARAAQSAGANIYTHIPIEHHRRVSGKWQLTSRQRKITADQVLLCTNGYTDDLYSQLRESIVPVVSIQAATQVLSEAQCQAILVNRHTFADTRRVIFYFRKTGENRLVFGSAGIADEIPGTAERQRILNGLNTVYPQFPTLKIDYIWGGKIAVTQDHLPHIHQPAPGIYAGLGCNGRGVALSTVMGRLLAELVLGKDKKALAIPITTIKKYPFHRFHRTGIKIAVHWKEFQDNREANA